MTLKLNNDYAVYTAEKQLLFSGTYQECLAFQKLREDDTFVDIDKSEEKYELADLPIDYTFED